MSTWSAIDERSTAALGAAVGSSGRMGAWVLQVSDCVCGKFGPEECPKMLTVTGPHGLGCGSTFGGDEGR